MATPLPSDEVTVPLQELLDTLKTQYESENRDCDCGWRNSAEKLHDTLLLMWEENEKLWKNAHKQWTEATVYDLNAWAGNMEISFNALREDILDSLLTRPYTTQNNMPQQRRYRIE